MLLPELLLAIVAGALYGLAWVFALRDARRGKLGLSGLVATIAGVIVHTLALAIRWVESGHPPVFGSFENSLLCAWFLALACIAVRPSRSWRHLPVGLLPSALVTLVWGVWFNRNRIPLTISERHLWIDIHAVVAWVAYVFLTAALLVAVLALVRAREAKRGREYALLADMPRGGWCEEIVAQSLAWSFVWFSAVIVTGSIYSLLLFGELWRWDTVEVLALIIWLMLGLTLHVRRFFGWRGWRVSAMVAFTYLGVIVIYWILALFPRSTYHYFELPF